MLHLLVRISSAIGIAILLLGIVSWPQPIGGRECGNVDVRNSLASFKQLNGCTVVRGFLMIVMITRNVNTTSFNNITFPELREVTDFMVLYNVKGMTTLRKMFPNLTVIRGRRLFLNYALCISTMPDMEAIELRSLIAIQRGHVYVGTCPKLCHLKSVNWDRLTLSPGENHIVPHLSASCNTTATCQGCSSGYCWSDLTCQKFENDNIINLIKSTAKCHSQCLGGCYNSTAEGCAVCRNVTSHGTCVAECPPNLYYAEHHQRCYTKEECGEFRFYVHGNVCERSCPAGFTSSRRLLECIKCVNKDCSRSCIPPEDNTTFFVYSLQDADELRGCHRLNGSLYILLRNKIDTKELERAFESIAEVQGYIKVITSEHLRSLKFLQNIVKIEGQELEDDTYGLVIYDNDRLREVWTTPQGKQLQLLKGGIYMDSNDQLCNKIIRQFVDSIIHDKEQDFIQWNDLEVLCDPAILPLEVRNVTQTNTTLLWPRNQTAEMVEVLYRNFKYDKGEDSELDDHICYRVHWKRDMMLASELEHNGTHFYYKITGLRPFTKYEALVKTFQGSNDYSARSQKHIFDTIVDYPTAPTVSLKSRTENSIDLAFVLRTDIPEKRDYFLLEIHEQPVNLEGLDSRNFCIEPAVNEESWVEEDYDDCCLRKEQELEEEQLRRDMLDLFPCSVETEENCPERPKDIQQRPNTIRLNSNLTSYNVTNLKHGTLYTFLIFSCNEIGCGAYYMFSSKTLHRPDADKVLDINACVMSDGKTYILLFDEPKEPNGAVVTYTIHFQEKPASDSQDTFPSFLHCITRKQHEMSNYRFTIALNDSYDQAAVRTTSIEGSILSDWFDIETCKSDEKQSGGLGPIGITVICACVIVLIAFIWVSRRRRWWGHIDWRREAGRFADMMGFEDRQILVHTYDTVTFQNVPEEEL